MHIKIERHIMFTISQIRSIEVKRWKEIDLIKTESIKNFSFKGESKLNQRNGKRK